MDAARDYVVALTERAAAILANGLAAKHHRGACAHEKVAERHLDAARYWRDRGDHDRAEVEVSSAVVQRRMAELERKRAELQERSRAGTPATSERTSRRPTASSVRVSAGSLHAALWQRIRNWEGYGSFRASGDKIRDKAGLELTRLLDDNAVRAWGPRLLGWSTLIGMSVALGMTIAMLLG